MSKIQYKSIADMISNKYDLYNGDLKYYFKEVFTTAQNVNHPYHNFRHMMHVFVMCYSAAEYYRESLTKTEIRNLLIAALYHDFNHTGKKVTDSVNIALSLDALKNKILPSDLIEYLHIENIILATEFPHKTPESDLSLSQKIICDVDVSQALTDVWVQQVVFGLSKEWGTSALEVLKTQSKFLSEISFYTNWASEMFPKDLISQKIDEANELTKILN
jgi:hypothetical protein